MPLVRATDVVARFDFPRDSASGIAAGGDTLAAVLQRAALPARALQLQSRPHRTDAAAILWAAAAVVLLVAALRRRRRRRAAVVAAVATGLGIAALDGGLDVLLPARPATHFEVVIEPRTAVQREILLSAHYDSKTEPFDHRGRAFAYAGAALTLVAVAVARRFGGAAAAALALAAFTAGAGRCAHARSHGIVDDAAAVALLVEIASAVHAEPLGTTRLRVVWWCDEESGAQGSAAWVRAVRLDALPRRAINLECIGAGPRLGYAAREWTGAGWRAADAELVRTLRAAAGGDLVEIAPPVVTDGGSLLRAGIAAVTLVGLGAGGEAPRGMHRPSDRLAALDAGGVAAAGALLRRVLAAADTDPTP